MRKTAPEKINVFRLHFSSSLKAVRLSAAALCSSVHSLRSSSLRAVAAAAAARVPQCVCLSPGRQAPAARSFPTGLLRVCGSERDWLLTQFTLFRRACTPCARERVSDYSGHLGPPPCGPSLIKEQLHLPLVSFAPDHLSTSYTSLYLHPTFSPPIFYFFNFSLLFLLFWSGFYIKKLCIFILYAAFQTYSYPLNYITFLLLNSHKLYCT